MGSFSLSPFLSLSLIRLIHSFAFHQIPPASFSLSFFLFLPERACMRNIPKSHPLWRDRTMRSDDDRLFFFSKNRSRSPLFFWSVWRLVLKLFCFCVGQQKKRRYLPRRDTSVYFSERCSFAQKSFATFLPLHPEVSNFFLLPSILLETLATITHSHKGPREKGGKSGQEIERGG